MVLGLIGSFGGVRPVLAAEYTLESMATYDVLPDDRVVAVAVDLEFTNTTPDPEGQFSIFEELRLAIHDGATNVTARDEEGELEVSVDDESGVNVATIALREGLRYEQTAAVELDYRLVDGASREVRVGPSLVAFPAWGFGTASEVEVKIPAGFEIRVDGDGLTEAADGTLTSGPIDDPDAWLAVVTALGPADYITFEMTVPLQGGTADVVVRAFGDDPEWGEATRDLVTEALPVLEREIGLPYPLIGQLIITEGAPTDTTGFGEPVTRRSEITVAHDQPPFTIVHQLAHVWLDTSLIEARWIGEGMASDLAARAAEELEIEPPYDPAVEAEERSADAIQLDAWGASTDPAQASYAYAASWALIEEIRDEVGDDALRDVLTRTTASIGAYDGAGGETPFSASPQEPLTSRSFLDQLGAVADVDFADRFAELVLNADDVALLPDRQAARDAFDELIEAAQGWGAPDPVRAAMGAWRFDEAMPDIDAAADWLIDRDALVADMERVGLSRPERLPQAYRAYGGGPEAVEELDAERIVVDAYAATAEQVNEPRSLLARLGLIGATDPVTYLNMANGLFAEGDLRGAMVNIEAAQRVLDSAETTGIVRLTSLVLLVVALAAIAITVFRRRASYTARP
jgi:hypothetical protein